VREICTRRRLLFVADEIQTALGRTGKMFCWEWDGAKPDAIIVGKALAGGMYPVSAFLSTDEVMASSTRAITARRSAAIRWVVRSAARR